MQVFEEARPRLLGLAYRILGSRADAEDAVQDTFLKWEHAERDTIESPASWFTTVCTRRCLDLLRSGERSRVDYVGAWLPEPIQTAIEVPQETGVELASSLTTAFMLMLERLTPRERAAYLLHDIFDVSYPEIAETLDVREDACRKLVSRAKAHIDSTKVRHVTPVEQQDRLLAAFRNAVSTGSAAELAALLSDDIRLTADGGGKVPAVKRSLDGKQEVTDFIAHQLHDFWADLEWSVVDMNGNRGLVLTRDSVTSSVVTFAYDETGAATGIFIMRNPDKLSRLDPVAIH